MARNTNRRLTDRQYSALWGQPHSLWITGHWKTLDSLARRGLIRSVRGWVEQPANRYHKRARATELTWGVLGFEITAEGRTARNLERVRRGA